MDFVPRSSFTSIYSVSYMQIFDFGFWIVHARLYPVFFLGRFFVGASTLSLIINTQKLQVFLCTFMEYYGHLTYLFTILFFAASFGFLGALFFENLIEINKTI